MSTEGPGGKKNNTLAPKKKYSTTPSFRMSQSENDTKKIDLEDSDKTYNKGLGKKRFFKCNIL